MIVETHVERGVADGGYHVGRRVPDIDRGDLQAGRREVIAPVVQGLADQRRQHPDHVVQRVVGKLRIGGMALGAEYFQIAVQAPAAADFHHVAETRVARGLAHHAGVQPFASVFQPAQHLAGAVDRDCFLVAGDQKADGAGNAVAAPFMEKAGKTGKKGGDRPFHIDRAAAEQLAVDHLAGKGVDPPGRRIARRHHVRVAGIAQVRAGRAQSCIEVFHVRRTGLGKGHAMTGEAKFLQPGLQQIERAPLDRGNARAAYQRLGELDGIEDGNQAGRLFSRAGVR
jgi:hypothetical protein